MVAEMDKKHLSKKNTSKSFPKQFLKRKPMMQSHFSVLRILEKLKLKIQIFHGIMTSLSRQDDQIKKNN